MSAVRYLLPVLIAVSAHADIVGIEFVQVAPSHYSTHARACFADGIVLSYLPQCAPVTGATIGAQPAEPPQRATRPTAQTAVPWHGGGTVVQRRRRGREVEYVFSR